MYSDRKYHIGIRHTPASSIATLPSAIAGRRNSRSGTSGAAELQASWTTNPPRPSTARPNATQVSGAAPRSWTLVTA